MAAPEKRRGLSHLAILASAGLLIMAVIGIVQAWIAVHAV